MITVLKKDGSPRRTVDLQNLNAATRRETHYTPSPFNFVSTVPPGKKKTVLDAWNGYLSVPLSGEACDATTFITEWRRYRYLRAPQASLHPTMATQWRFHFGTVNYIRLCVDDRIVFKPDKFHFAKDNVGFDGFSISSTRYKPAQKL